MIGSSHSKLNEPREQETRRILASAGAAYGLVFGLGFALLMWGRDALLLASSGATLAWTKLLIGLPIAVTLCVLAGRLVGSTSSTAICLALWAVTGSLLGLLAGRLPFDGGNLAAWSADRRLWGLVVFPYTEAAATRTTILMVTGTIIGLVVGFFEDLVVGWSWDRATPSGRMSVQSWLALLVCVPLALPVALLAEDQVHQRLRIPQQRVGTSIKLAKAGADEKAFERLGLNYRVVTPFSDRMSGQPRLYLAGYQDVVGFTTAQVDVVFENEFTLRCHTQEIGMFLSPEHRVLSCTDLGKIHTEWMGDLAHAGLTGEQRWLDSPLRLLDVSDDVLAWLASHQDELSELYEVSRAGQQGGWLFLSARFDTGFEMTCRFQGVSPAHADRCEATNVSMP